MDVFAIEKGKALKLSVDEFEKQTCHEYPYYRTKKDKRLSLYAICPECGNPIQIVNMYGEEMMQNVTRKVTLYGKHTGRAVEGFPYWNEAESSVIFRPPFTYPVLIRYNRSYNQQETAPEM